MSDVVIKELFAKIKTYVSQLEQLLEESSKEPKPPMEAVKKEESGVCLLCDMKIAKDDKHFRGCHMRCHRKVDRLIKSGELTDNQAISRGLWLPKKKGGRVVEDPNLSTRGERQSKKK